MGKTLERPGKTESPEIQNLQKKINDSLNKDRVAILPPLDVEKANALMNKLSFNFTVSMLDPWYNKGFGEFRADYNEFMTRVLEGASPISQHIYFWGFPEIVVHFIPNIPKSFKLTAWLTWYYKNNPSVIRGWRSSQMACLHLSKPKAKLYPEHFLNEAQLKLKEAGKLRYMPGPTSVIEQSLLVGFIGKKEQTGHKTQKPVALYEKLFLMTTVENNLVYDPMAGSGTTGVIAQKFALKAILCDHSEKYTEIMENRINVKRLNIESEIDSILS